ncbi:MAG TPA: rhodanese-like domain-containing protein [Paraburkholderia sp.]
MFFRRFYDDGLAQASYLIGCDATREAIVVDPNRDTAQYVDAAAAEHLRIVRVTETHIHADFVSGSRELAARTGATLMLSGEGGDDWQYAFAAADGAVTLRDGDSFDIGQVRFDVMHTPGHTPEHLAFLVTDRAASDRPVGLISGDAVFVGDVGRPDLLERAAGVADSMDAAARALFRTLQRVRELPGFVQLWPGHGAGSACGKALGALPQSTIGYECVANWGLIARDEDAFVHEVLDGQPEPPPYFAVMKRINRDGPTLLNEWPRPAKLEPGALASALRAAPVAGAGAGAGRMVVDVRTTAEFAEAHVGGAVNVPVGRSLATWCGWLIPYDCDVQLIASREDDAVRAAGTLAKIGLDRVTGWIDAGAIAASSGSVALESVRQATPAELAPLIASGAVALIDVRNAQEWAHGHIPGALHIPVGQLALRLGEIPRGQPVAVQCQGGTRSAIAASVLLSRGIPGVINLRGGYDEWARAGLPLAHD